VSVRRYFLVRLAWALGGLWIAATIVFIVFYVAVDPAKEHCRGQQDFSGCIELVDDAYHLDSPRHEQYAFFLRRLVVHQSTGSFVSDSGEVAREALPATLSLVVPALVLAAVVGFFAGGALARLRWRRIFDLPIYVAIGLSPIFVALVFSFYLAFKWDLVPIGGYCDFFNPPPQPSLAPPQPSLEPGAEQCGGAVDWATHLVLPVITLSLYFAAIYTRVVRALVVQVRSEKTPREQRRRRRRSALLFARSVGRDFGFAVGVAVFVEAAFQIPGLGRSTVTSIYAGNLVGTQAYLLYATFLAIFVQFVVDIVVGALDPSLRWERPVARRPKPA
jgi:peptide/nickel transport system permease protein